MKYLLLILILTTSTLLHGADPFLPKFEVEEFSITDVDRSGSSYVLSWKLVLKNKESGTKPAEYLIVPLDRFAKTATQWTSRGWFQKGELEVKPYGKNEFIGTFAVPTTGVEKNAIVGVGILFTRTGGLSQKDKEYTAMSSTSIYGDAGYGNLMK